ncbi:glycosyltransferase [Rhodococcoides fascians]|uniref:glycosyltransferase n=1 Tax=Rhodococcoides fascians TaxID=1828 RepID=UPI00068CB3D9|nr:glycosyltransferase [Rhodococcus fascians]
MTIDAHRTVRPTVSVVIPMNGIISQLDEQLDGLAQQNYSGEFEVVVADNGVGDLLRRHISDHSLNTRMKIQYIDASEQAGVSFARNCGARHASGEFLAFCDADDIVHENWISSLVGFAQDFDVVGTAVETAGINTAKAMSWTPSMPAERQGRTTFLPHAIGASMGAWTGAWRDLGGMDTSYHASEDVEFCWRAQLAGYTFGFLPVAEVAYRLREELRPLLRQSYKLGYGFARLQGEYRARGCPPVSVRRVAYWWTLLILGNPLVPSFVTKVSRGQWARAVAAHAGEVRGGLKYHTFGW